jgi:hypothetical protein
MTKRRASARVLPLLLAALLVAAACVEVSAMSTPNR